MLSSPGYTTKSDSAEEVSDTFLLLLERKFVDMASASE